MQSLEDTSNFPFSGSESALNSANDNVIHHDKNSCYKQETHQLEINRGDGWVNIPQDTCYTAMKNDTYVVKPA